MNRRPLLALGGLLTVVAIGVGIAIGGFFGFWLAWCVAVGCGVTAAAIVRAKSYAAPPESARPRPSDASGRPPDHRWVGGGNIPGSLMRTQATWPLVVAELSGDVLTIRLRPPVMRIFGAFGATTFVPGPDVVVFPSRAAIGNRGVAVQRGSEAPWYLLVRDRDRVLSALQTVGFRVEADERRMQYF